MQSQPIQILMQGDKPWIFFKGSLKQRLRSHQQKKSNQKPPLPAGQQKPLSARLHGNLQDFTSIFSDSTDVIFHTFMIFGQRKACLIYIQGLSNTGLIDRHVLAPLTAEDAPDPEQGEWQGCSLLALSKRKITVSNSKELKKTGEVIEQITAGNPVLLIDQESRAISLGLAKWEGRGVESPDAESVVRGPREGFTETLEVNTSLLRRKIRTPALKIKSLKTGRYTQTQIVIAYMEGIADKTLIREVVTRVNRIDIDGVLESRYIEELISDNRYTPFPQMIVTERPDVVAANLLEGRVAILVDGTPFSLIAPASFFSLLQSPEDYYQDYLVSTAIRWLRSHAGSFCLRGNPDLSSRDDSDFPAAQHRQVSGRDSVSGAR